MKKEELEKYVSELSPEMQKKARECKTMDELNTFLAENDIDEEFVLNQNRSVVCLKKALPFDR